MAAGERHSNGKPKDIVRHMWGNNSIEVGYGLFKRKIWDGETLCGRSDVGYASDDKSDVTCLKCLNKIREEQKNDNT